VPAQILVALVAKLKLYGFRPAAPSVAELNAYFGAAWREQQVGRGGGRFWDLIGMGLAA
jgi:hypothetical protein